MLAMLINLPLIYQGPIGKFGNGPCIAVMGRNLGVLAASHRFRVPGITPSSNSALDSISSVITLRFPSIPVDICGLSWLDPIISH